MYLMHSDDGRRILQHLNDATSYCTWPFFRSITCSRLRLVTRAVLLSLSKLKTQCLLTSVIYEHLGAYLFIRLHVHFSSSCAILNNYSHVSTLPCTFRLSLFFIYVCQALRHISLSLIFYPQFLSTDLRLFNIILEPPVDALSPAVYSKSKIA